MDLIGVVILVALGLKVLPSGMGMSLLSGVAVCPVLFLIATQPTIFKLTVQLLTRLPRMAGRSRGVVGNPPECQTFTYSKAHAECCIDLNYCLVCRMSGSLFCFSCLPRRNKLAKGYLCLCFVHSRWRIPNSSWWIDINRGEHNRNVTPSWFDAISGFSCNIYCSNLHLMVCCICWNGVSVGFRKEDSS